MRKRYQLWGRAWFLCGVISVAVSMTACGQGQMAVTVHSVPIHPVPGPPGVYSGTAWLRDNWLVFSYGPDPDIVNGDFPIWQMRPDGSQMRKLNLPEDEQHCRRTEFSSPQALQDGRVAFRRICLWPEGTLMDSFNPRLVVWDPRDDSSGLLFAYKLPAHVAMFTLAPDASRGLLATDTGIKDSMFWLDKEAARPVNINLVRARRPAWSPDGQSIVFFGNRELRGRAGPQWVDQPHDLWIMPADCERRPGGCVNSVTILIRNILYPGTVSWSPNGRWLAFDGNPQGQGEGIWLIQVNTETLIQVIAGQYRGPEWSPDGNHLVVVGPPEGGKQDMLDFRSALYILDVSDVIGQ